jgi:hypothetical protein
VILRGLRVALCGPRLDFKAFARDTFFGFIWGRSSVGQSAALSSKPDGILF